MGEGEWEGSCPGIHGPSLVPFTLHPFPLSDTRLRPMSDPSDLSAVEALLQERDALRGWLDRLDRSDAAVPESVRDRVRQDYQSRLDGMLDRLRQHADVVATRLLADQAERDRLSDQ